MIEIGKQGFVNIVIYAIMGIVLAMITNKIYSHVDKFELDSKIKLAIKFLIFGSVLYYVHHYISKEFASDWQSTTPGLFFVSMYFGLQPNLMNQIAQLLF
jgi:hypothetical protein